MTCQLYELNMLGQVNLFNKQVVFELRIPDTFTKQVGFRSTHLAEYSGMTQHKLDLRANTNCHP